MNAIFKTNTIKSNVIGSKSSILSLDNKVIIREVFLKRALVIEGV